MKPNQKKNGIMLTSRHLEIKSTRSRRQHYPILNAKQDNRVKIVVEMKQEFNLIFPHFQPRLNLNDVNDKDFETYRGYCGISFVLTMKNEI